MAVRTGVAVAAGLAAVTTVSASGFVGARLGVVAAGDGLGARACGAEGFCSGGVGGANGALMTTCGEVQAGFGLALSGALSVAVAASARTGALDSLPVVGETTTVSWLAMPAS